MYYEESKARELVVAAGLKLVEEGLIARTWGNISARISDDEFIITPSGRAYEDLKPEDLVKVKMDDLSYDGNIKPSSEKGIHAVAYILRKELGFIIHTHQFYATVIGLDGKDKAGAACAGYGLPGTDKLKDNVMQAISKHPSYSAFLLQRHGALLLGKDFDDAFKLASLLENEARIVFETELGNVKPYFEACKKMGTSLPAYIDDFAQILGPSVSLKKEKDEICVGEDREAEEMILDKNCACMLYAKEKHIRPLGFADANIQRLVYKTKYSKLK
ncbi:MAG: class II aldolase/adducin family protein [Clostridia bacterium]|nr:class II aldolase/adducin family protein [Clostridia bacterium]